MTKENVYIKRRNKQDWVSIPEPREIVYFLSSIVNEDCHGKYKIAACLARRRHIIVSGHNSVKTHPFQFRHAANHHKIYMHAEIHTILNYYKYIRNHDERISNNMDLYILRLTRNNECADSHPCDGCLSAIRHTEDIRNIIFFQDGSWRKISNS